MLLRSDVNSKQANCGQRDKKTSSRRLRNYFQNSERLVLRCSKDGERIGELTRQRRQRGPWTLRGSAAKGERIKLTKCVIHSGMFVRDHPGVVW